MSAVFSNRIARRRAITYVALLAASLLLMAVSANPFVTELQGGIGYAFRPVQGAIDGFGRNLRSIATSIAEIDRLRTENEALRAENDRIRIENLRATEIGRENEALTALLQLRNGFEYDTVAAAVIGRESSEVQQRILIDRGTAQGVAVGDVVIAGGGALVGRVVDVGAASATVQLISDSASAVIGQLVGTADTGKVVGQLPGSLTMGDINAAAEVSLGEEVVTAGIELGGGIRSPYPKGLVIGQVIDVRRDANEIVQTAFLEPAAPLDRLEYVLVILDYAGGLPPPEQQPTDCQPSASGTLPDSEQPCVEPTASPAVTVAPTP
ncbi:MAG: rod shape-determining protein MreC [Candidatus Limnocylindrales bacterium]